LAQDPFFLTLVLGMFCGTFAGMLVIGNLKPIGLAAGVPAISAAAAIGAFAIGNASGRIAWGWISDRTDERMIPVKLAALGVPLALLAWVSSPTPFIVVSFAVGFGFGACFVVYAAQVASRYGPARVGGVYPIVFLAYGVAGLVGPVLGGWLYDVTSSYTPAIAVSCGVVGVGILGSILLLRQAKRSRLVRSAQ
jgi:OFA family oxalate/formate antiporter-like MFS transporter